jgi:hypothetical protein
MQRTETRTCCIDQVGDADDAAREIDVPFGITIVRNDVLADGYIGRSLRMETRAAANCGKQPDAGKRGRISRQRMPRHRLSPSPGDPQMCREPLYPAGLLGVKLLTIWLIHVNMTSGAPLLDEVK